MMNLFLSFPKLSALYAGVFGLFYLAISINVIRYRWKERKGLGHDSDPKSGLFRAVRVHGNFMEFVPFILFLMALDEMTGRSATFLHSLGIALFIGRLCHYFGITKSHLVSWQRSVGVALTYSILALLSINLILKGVS